MTSANRRVPVTLAASLALLAAGCGSYRRVAPLDPAEQAEMEVLRARLSGTRAIVPSGSPGGAVLAALERLGVGVDAPAGAPTTGAAEIHAERTGQCMNPMLLTIVTLGIVPCPTQPITDLRCRFVAPDGRETVKAFQLDDGMLIGWIGLPLGLLPGWSPFVGSGEHEDQRSAIRDRFALFLGRSLAADRP